MTVFIVPMNMFVSVRMMMAMFVRVRCFVPTVACQLLLQFLFIRHAVQRNRDAHRVDAVFENRLRLNLPAIDRQRCQTFAQSFNRHTAIYQRAQRHIAGNAGKTIEISNSHNL